MKKFVLMAAALLAIANFSFAGSLILTQEGGATRSRPTIATLLIEFKPNPSTKEEQALALLQKSLSDSYEEPGQFGSIEDAPPCARTKAAAQGHGAWVKRMVRKDRVPVTVTKIIYNCVSHR